MDDRAVISSDSHIVEPPELFIDRMDPKYNDRIPHLVHEDPYDFWYVDNQKLGVLGSFGASAGMRFDRPQDIIREGRMKDILPGGYDPHARIQDMDLDGVYADVLYPSIGLELYGIEDKQILRDIFAAYNDWLSDYCSSYPNRLKGIAMILLDDEIHAGIKDLYKASKGGFVGAMISVFPSPQHFYDQPMYEPFWQVAQELDMTLSLHVSTNRPSSVKSPTTSGVSQSGANRVNAEYWVRMSLCHLVLSGVFERFPDLRVIEVEHDLAWLPFFFNRLDITYKERTTQTPYRYKGGFLPSDFMRRNVFHSFQEDDLGIRDRDIIGVENLLWGSDYPHAESTFPKSQEILDRILCDVPDEERALIVGGNASKLYKFT